MQYILTQAEYDALRSKQAAQLQASKEELQALATKAALHIPVTLSWRPEVPPAPWGCILADPANNPGYCDECPAQLICPHDGKEWSQ